MTTVREVLEKEKQAITLMENNLICQGVIKQKPLTYKDACEIISQAKFITNLHGEYASPEEVFNSSENGELFHISHWYNKAIIKLYAENNQEDFLDE